MSHGFPLLVIGWSQPTFRVKALTEVDGISWAVTSGRHFLLAFRRLGGGVAVLLCLLLCKCLFVCVLLTWWMLLCMLFFVVWFLDWRRGPGLGLLSRNGLEASFSGLQGLAPLKARLVLPLATF